MWGNGTAEGPDWDSVEADRIHWNPDAEKETIGAATPQQRIFPEEEGYCIAWCKLRTGAGGDGAYSLVIESFGYNKVYLGGKLQLVCEAVSYTHLNAVHPLPAAFCIMGGCCRNSDQYVCPAEWND